MNPEIIVEIAILQERLEKMPNVHTPSSEKKQLERELRIIGKYRIGKKDKESYVASDWSIIEEFIKLSPEDQNNKYNDLRKIASSLSSR